MTLSLFWQLTVDEKQELHNFNDDKTLLPKTVGNEIQRTFVKGHFREGVVDFRLSSGRQRKCETMYEMFSLYVSFLF